MKEVYFYIVEVIPKHNAQDMTNVSGNIFAVHPIAEVVAVVEKRQTMSQKVKMKTRVMQVISLAVKDCR